MELTMATATPLPDAAWRCDACGRMFRPANGTAQQAGIARTNAASHAAACSGPAGPRCCRRPAPAEVVERILAERRARIPTYSGGRFVPICRCASKRIRGENQGVETVEVSDRRARALERFERAVELPLLILALTMVPLLLAPLVFEFPSGVESTFTGVEWFIWAAFAFEYAVRLGLTSQRWSFVRREWAALLIIALPFLRPLRIVRSARALRVLRLLRLVGALGTVGSGIRRLMVRHRLHYALAVTGLVVLGAAALALGLEDGHGGSIDSFGDALWWATTTVTTVGYGDMFPVTPGGRGIAVFLMITGIALFGVLTANVAAFFIEEQKDDDAQPKPALDQATADEILKRLAAMETLLAADRTSCPNCQHADAA
ncbi:MAG: potassium channel family protein [Gemmatimonadales bacterium]